MLIAMMGNTYAHVIEQSEKEWMKQVRQKFISADLINLMDDNSILFDQVGKNCGYFGTSRITNGRSEIPGGIFNTVRTIRRFWL